ncbi:DUF397 domain-containing protein [Streptomyces chumphonensis]|uniref:DUF397 domain-containing protein n=1 Tax=Streptomyces chumphonensis TaxID=1214925 RepID=UPI003D765AEE
MNTHSIPLPRQASASPGSWFKSSYSDHAGGNCIEVADLGATVGVRDSKDLSRPAFLVPREAFAAFAAFASSHGTV